MVEVRLAGDTSYRAKSRPPRGHPKNPLSRRELEDKFIECAEPNLARRSIQRMIDTIWSLERVRSIAEMMADFRESFAGK